MASTFADAYSFKLWFLPSMPGRLKSGAVEPMANTGGVSGGLAVTSSCA